MEIFKLLAVVFIVALVVLAVSRSGYAGGRTRRRPVSHYRRGTRVRGRRWPW